MKIRVSFLFFVTLFICLFFGNPLYFFITYISLTVHELVHLFFLYKENVEVSFITLEAFGISIKTKKAGFLTPLVYLSAPIFNILISLLLYLIYKKTQNSLFLNFGATNFALGFFNLLPILPLDGGRAMLSVVKQKFFFVFLSGFFGLIILLLGILFIRSLNFNFSLIMIGIFIIANSFSEREQLFESEFSEDIIRIKNKIL